MYTQGGKTEKISFAAWHKNNSYIYGNIWVENSNRQRRIKWKCSIFVKIFYYKAILLSQKVSKVTPVTDWVTDWICIKCRQKCQVVFNRYRRKKIVNEWATEWQTSSQILRIPVLGKPQKSSLSGPTTKKDFFLRLYWPLLCKLLQLRWRSWAMYIRPCSSPWRSWSSPSHR